MMKYCLRTILGRYLRNSIFAKNHCKIKVRTILICSLYSRKYDTWYPFGQQKGREGATIISIMTLSITTPSIMALSLMTFSIMTFSIMTFIIMTFSIMTLSMKVDNATLSIMVHQVMLF